MLFKDCYITRIPAILKRPSTSHFSFLDPYKALQKHPAIKEWTPPHLRTRDSKIFPGMNFSLFKYRLEALWIFFCREAKYIFCAAKPTHLLPSPKFYRPFSTLKFARVVYICRSCPPGKPISHTPSKKALATS